MHHSFNYAVGSSLVLFVGSFLFAGGLFSNTFVLPPDDSQQMRSQKHEDAWPKFKCELCALYVLLLFIMFRRVHVSARVEKSVNKKLLDRIDIVPACGVPKHVSLHVNCLDDVVTRCVVWQTLRFCPHRPTAYPYFPSSSENVCVRMRRRSGSMARGCDAPVQVVDQTTS